MSVDLETVRRVSSLVRIKLSDPEVEIMKDELDKMLSFVDCLKSVDTLNVEPTSVVSHNTLSLRTDALVVENNVDEILLNAPSVEENFFLVPKVIE